MPNEFVAVDVETANADLASICQIGVVSFSDGHISDSWQSLVNPEDYFSPINVSIHGIDEDDVREAPSFSGIAAHLASVLGGQIVATHTGFDRVSLQRAHEDYDLPHFACTWLDTARVSRRAWTRFARKGYGLADVAAFLDIEFRHHDAVEDARAAGSVLLRAIGDTGLQIHDWLKRVEQPIDPTLQARLARSGDPDGPLAGEVIAFTGALSMSRREAATVAASAGCDVESGVTQKTTLLVVGDQDLRKLAGHQKSSKHRKAEKLIAAGQQMRILGERDFRELVKAN